MKNISAFLAGHGLLECLNLVFHDGLTNPHDGVLRTSLRQIFIAKCISNPFSELSLYLGKMFITGLSILDKLIFIGVGCLKIGFQLIFIFLKLGLKYLTIFFVNLINIIVGTLDQLMHHVPIRHFKESERKSIKKMKYGKWKKAKFKTTQTTISTQT